MSDINTFSYHAYVALIRRLESGRTLRFYEDTDANNLHETLILRHDVDQSMQKAVELARIENEHGLISTYFVLLATNTYNLFYGGAYDALKEIVRLGHRIGLHYDVKMLRERQNTPEKALKLEAEILSDICGQDVNVIAMHNPSVYGDDIVGDIPGLINVNDVGFKKQVQYYSDSAGGWRDETYAALSNIQPPCGIELNTHPEHWNERWIPWRERLDLFVTDRTREALDIARETEEGWRNHIGFIQQEQRVRRTAK